LGSAHAQPSFGGARGDPERLYDAADGIERGGEVSRIFPRVGPGGPANHIGGHVRLMPVFVSERAAVDDTIYASQRSRLRDPRTRRERGRRYWLSPGTCRYLHDRLAIASRMDRVNFDRGQPWSTVAVTVCCS
jgi:hypothetical protein